jgi:hypothetical protein
MAIIDYRGHRVVAQVCIENIFLYISLLEVFLYEHVLQFLFFHS